MTVENRQHFTVFHDNNSTFEDYSFEAKEYLKDPFTLTLLNATSYIYVGYYKAFNTMYFSMSTPNVNANTFAAEYYDKDDENWKTLDIRDESKGWTRDGFLTFRKPSDSGRFLWKETTVNGEELFWIRLKPSVDHSATTHRGLGILLSTDDHLEVECPGLVADHAPSAVGSFVLTHEAVKDDIVQKLRNAGNRKQRTGSNRDIQRLRDINEFDLLDSKQISQSAKYYALEKIFINLSDTVGDKWESKAIQFRIQADEAFNVFFLSLDLDDDGEDDTSEVLRSTRIDITRP